MFQTKLLGLGLQRFRGLKVRDLGLQEFGTRILSGPFIIWVPFFLLFGFNKGIRK